MPHPLRNLPLISIPTSVPAHLPQHRAGAVQEETGQEETGAFKNSTAKTSSMVSLLVPLHYPHRLSRAPCLSGAPSGKAGCDPPSPGRLSPIPGGLQVPTGNLRVHLLSPGELNRGTFSQSHASYSSTLISFRILSSEINVFKFNKIAPCHCYGLEASQYLLVL